MGSAEYRAKLKERARINRLAFQGQYKDELNDLIGLSKGEIDKITPGTTDLETYAQLVSVVKEASANNISQAELKSSVIELGKVGIEIAKKIPKLAALFI